MIKLITKTGVLFFVITFFTTFKGWAQDSLVISIDEALIISCENNPLMKQVKNLKQEKELNLKAAKGHFYPIVSIGANYQLMSKDITLDMNPIKDAILPLYNALGNYGDFSGVPNPDPATSQIVPIFPDDISTQIVRKKLLEGAEMLQAQDWEKTIQKRNFGTVTANVLWPVFTGGKIKAANKAAKIEVAEAENEVLMKKVVLSKELIERYYGLRLADRVIDIRKQVFDVMEMHLNNAEKMFQEGVIAESQLLHAKVFHAEAQRELKKAKRQYSIVEKALKNTLALSDDSAIKPISKLFITTSLQTLPDYLTAAQKNNPILRKIELKKQLSLQNVAVKKSDYFPTVAVMGMYDIYNHNLSETAPEWLAGINLKWNLFDGLSRERKIKSAKYKTMQVDNLYEKVGNDINTLVEKLYQQLQMDIEQMNELETSEAFSQSYFKVTQKSFEEGIATSTDVTEASIALSKVQIDRLQVMYNYVKTLAYLLEATGNMDEFSSYQNNTNTIFEK